MNDDFTEWTFHLRPGVRWSDGELFTARTMYDYWRYYRANPDINPQIDPDKVVIEDNAITFTDEPLEAVGRTVRKAIIDDYTIKYTSDKPYPFLINSASHSYSMMESVIRPMHFLNQLDPTFIGMEAAQTLAQKAGFEHWYQLYLQVGRAQRQSSGQFIGNLPPTLAPYVMVDVGAARRVYERNPYYWKVDTAGQQLPYIDRIVTNQVTDREAVDARIIAGDADFAGFNTNTPSIPLYRQYEEQGGYRTTIWQNTFTALVLWPNYCYADEALATAFRNRDFRMALQLAVDRHRINDEVMFGQSRVVRHVPKPETNILFEKELETKYIEFEPERSAAILDEIGYVDADGDGWRDAPGGAPLKWTHPLHGRGNAARPDHRDHPGGLARAGAQRRRTDRRGQPALADVRRQRAAHAAVALAVQHPAEPVARLPWGSRTQRRLLANLVYLPRSLRRRAASRGGGVLRLVLFRST